MKLRIRGWLEWALACGEEASPALRARALDWVGNIAESQGEFGTAVATTQELLSRIQA